MIIDHLKLQKRNLERDIKNLNIELAQLDAKTVEALKARVVLTEQLRLIEKQLNNREAGWQSGEGEDW